MDFIRYAERAASLVNADLPDEAALHEHLADRTWLHRSVTADHLYHHTGPLDGGLHRRTESGAGQMWTLTAPNPLAC